MNKSSYLAVILFQAPGNSGSVFYNYKGTFSFVLLAVADADYKVILRIYNQNAFLIYFSIFSSSMSTSELKGQAMTQECMNAHH